MPLSLSRRPGEVFFVGDDVMVEVIGVQGHTVRLRISAPRAKAIVRAELLPFSERAKAEQAAEYTPVADSGPPRVWVHRGRRR